MSRAGGVGSWPGTDGADVREAVRVVRDTMTDASRSGEPGVPYLPELPERGPGADMIGRTAGMLADLSVDLQPSGWRIVDRPGRDVGRARAYLRADLDELAEAYDGYTGPLKVQAVGPWTLAAEVRLTRGERLVVDPGACRDLAQSLTEGLLGHLADLRRLVPGASVLVQLDEPSLPAVLSGALATSSGFGRLRAVDPEEARRLLAEVVSAVTAASGTDVVVHCCAPRAPLSLLREAGVAAVSLDLATLGPRAWESVAVCVEAGMSFWAGALPTDDLGRRPDAVIAPVVRAWDELGLPRASLAGVVLTPACGLAGASPDRAVRAHRRLVEAAGALTEAAG